MHPRLIRRDASHEAATRVRVTEPFRQGITTIAITWLVGLSVTLNVTGFVTAFWTPSRVPEVARNLTEAVTADCSWLLPTLFGALIAFAALFAGQTLSGAGATATTRSQRVIGASSHVVAGLSALVWSLVICNAFLDPAAAGQIWSAGVLTIVIVLSALGVGGLVFGSPREQLRRAREGVTRERLRLHRLRPAQSGARTLRPHATWLTAASIWGALVTIDVIVFAVLYARTGHPRPPSWLDLAIIAGTCAWSVIAALIPAAASLGDDRTLIDVVATCFLILVMESPLVTVIVLTLTDHSSPLLVAAALATTLVPLASCWWPARFLRAVQFANLRVTLISGRRWRSLLRIYRLYENMAAASAEIRDAEQST